MLLAVSNWSPKAEEQAVRTFIAQQADAIILTGFSHTDRTRKMLAQYGRPIVESWNISDTVIDSAVGFDNYAAAAEMTRYLIEQGYNDIVLVSGASENIDQFADRRRGFVDTMRDAGREVTPETIVQFENPATIESGGPLISTVLSRKSPPDAVMFLAELPAQGAMLWCLSNAVRVPEDIAIAGFGDLSHSALLPVPMTTVQIRGRAIGERTAEIICKRLQGEESGRLVELSLPPLIICTLSRRKHFLKRVVTCSSRNRCALILPRRGNSPRPLALQERSCWWPMAGTTSPGWMRLRAWCPRLVR